MLKFKNLKQRSINTNNFGSNKDCIKTFKKIIHPPKLPLKISYTQHNCQNISNQHNANPTKTAITIGQQSQT